MTKILLLISLSLTYLQANCKEYKLIGSKNQNRVTIDSKESIVWDKQDALWNVSQPMNRVRLTNSTCKNSGYVLINNNDIKYKIVLHHTNYYDLKKGWNYLTTPKDGVDVRKTFLDVEFVYVYDKRSQEWAGFSPEAELMSKIKRSRILELNYIEPKQGFYVLSTKAMRVGIVSKLPNAECQKIMRSKKYDLIYDSGADTSFSFNSIKSVGVKSRYLLHTRKGIYDDSRVLIMVPKLQKLSKNSILKKYGPAIPKMMIHFNEAYSEKEFFAYDYLNNLCYKGVFPSRRLPPQPTLKEFK